MIKDAPVFPHQAEFIESEAKHTCLVGGYGSAKSHAGIVKTIIKKLQYPGLTVVYYLPNYSLVRDIAFVRFPELLNELGLHYQLNKSNPNITIQGYGDILFRNLMNPERIIGYENAYACIDEIDTLPLAKAKEVFQKIQARCRLPLPDGKYNQVDIVSTPEGYRFLYDRFVVNAHPDYKLIKAKTTDNTFLPESYIETLKESYDPKMLKQYLDGEFINVNGSNVYHQFNRDVHVVDDIDIDITLPLIITFDFNINPYNAILLLQVKQGNVYVIDNAIKLNAALVDSLNHLKEKFAHLGDYLYSATIYGDATGKARSQGTAQTNYHLITEAGFVNQMIKTSNPRVQDRVNTVNSMLKNGRGEIKLFICKRNKELIIDLERMAYDDKGIIDKTDQELSHASDSVGYYIEYEHRLIKQQTIKAKYY